MCIHILLKIKYKNNFSIFFFQRFQTCVDDCIRSNKTRLEDESINTNRPAMKQIHENYILNLICRDDSSLNFRIDLQMNENKHQQLLKSKTMLYPSLSSAEGTIAGPEREERNVKAYAYGSTIFVIKVHLAKNAEKFFEYLVSSYQQMF